MYVLDHQTICVAVADIRAEAAGRIVPPPTFFNLDRSSTHELKGRNLLGTGRGAEESKGNPVLRNLIAEALIVAVVAGSGMVGSSTASARPIREGTAPAGCPVEQEDGTILTVEHGTRIGLFYCYNGDWRFGTIMLDD